jgi:hypothetical protein
MSAMEYRQWQAYYGVEPFGSDRLDVGLAIVAATVANCAPFRKKGAKRAKVEDFIPEWRKAESLTPEQRARRIQATLWAFADAQNAYTRRKRAKAGAD